MQLLQTLLLLLLHLLLLLLLHLLLLPLLPLLLLLLLLLCARRSLGRCLHLLLPRTEALLGVG